MTSTFIINPSTTVTVTVTAVTPEGPYRLDVRHPAKQIVEYFDTPFAALDRHAEIETALRGQRTPQGAAGTGDAPVTR
jgi:hypothetical protein